MSFTHSQPGPITGSGNKSSFKSVSFEPADFGAEPPFSQYQSVKGLPYTVKYFGLDQWALADKYPELDSVGLKDVVKFVEDFATREIARKKLYDSPESYRAIMREIKVKLNIGPKDRSDLVFKRIYQFIKQYRGKSAYGK